MADKRLARMPGDRLRFSASRVQHSITWSGIHDPLCREAEPYRGG